MTGTLACIVTVLLSKVLTVYHIIKQLPWSMHESNNTHKH